MYRKKIEENNYNKERKKSYQSKQKRTINKRFWKNLCKINQNIKKIRVKVTKKSKLNIDTK